MSSSNGSSKKPAETELSQKPAKRVFTPEYKRRIVEEINAAPRGGIAAILRREGLYSTTVDNWRRELAGALEPRKRGRRPSAEKETRRELERLERENARLKRKLEHAELIIDVQKKVARMLDQPTDGNDPS